MRPYIVLHVPHAVQVKRQQMAEQHQLNIVLSESEWWVVGM